MLETAATSSYSGARSMKRRGFSSASLPEFVKLAAQYNLIPLSKEIVVDRVTPVSVFERLQKNESHTFLLESVEGGERFGRYSFVGQRPHAVFVCRGKEISYREGAKE